MVIQGFSMMNAPTAHPDAWPTAVRLSLFYVAFFSVVGVLLPFWPVWLRSRGLDAAEIGAVLAVMLAAKTVVAPALASLADRWGRRKLMVVIQSALACVVFLLFWPAQGFVWVFAVSLLYTTAWTGLMPMGDNLAMLAMREKGLEYGRLRLWGSLSFIGVATAAGWFLAGRDADWVFALMLTGHLATVGGCLLLPDLRLPTASRPFAPLRRLLSNRVFLWFVLCVTLVQSSHSIYYAFATLHWRAAGHGEAVIGVLWAEGVIAEVVLFALGGAWVRRMGPGWAVVLGGLAGVLRWTVEGLSTDLLPLIAVQALHAFTFGAVHLATIDFIMRAVPTAYSATAQALYAALAFGIGAGVAMVVSGQLYAAFGAWAFLAMAGLAGVGAGLAFVFARRWDGRRVIADDVSEVT